MGKRQQEAFSEALRKQYSRNIYSDVRLLDTDTLLHHVDAEEVNKHREYLSKQMSSSVRRTTERTGDAEDMERFRDTKGDYRPDAREWPLDMTPEQVFFDYYGHGFPSPSYPDGSPVMDWPGAGYDCPCGFVKMRMVSTTMPHKCPKCGRITPMGMIYRDQVWKSYL